MSAHLLEQVTQYLTSLRLPRAQAMLPTVLAQAERGEGTLLEALATLLGEEATARETRRLKTTLSTSPSRPPWTGRACRPWRASTSSGARRTWSSSGPRASGRRTWPSPSPPRPPTPGGVH